MPTKIGKRLRWWLFALPLSFFLSGCVSLADVNEAILRVDKVWRAEYADLADTHRQRIVDAPYEVAMQAVQGVFEDFEMAFVVDSAATGHIISESDAPKPLDAGEWREIAAEETLRVREVGAWYLEVSEDPAGYVVQLQARITPIDAQRTAVALDYTLDNPSYRRLGVIPSQYAPPKAVQIATNRFWKRLGERLSAVGTPNPRKRKPSESDVQLEDMEKV
jgi:hypothetical protein